MSKPTEDQINEVLNKCSEAEEGGETKWPGMTYEQGVKNGIEWVLGYISANPVEE